MSLFDPIFNYCERTEIGLLAEPINAITNASFLIAAYFAYRAYKTNNKKDGGIILLIILTALVGIGSGLFHTFANGITMLADIIPITLFVLCYLFLALKRLIGISTRAAACWLGLFVAVAASMRYVPEPFRFNGSVDYFPCLAALIILGWCARHKKLFLAAGIFTASLTFRSIDIALCPTIHFGTHFMWHVLNGVLLYTLVKILITDCARAQSV